MIELKQIRNGYMIKAISSPDISDHLIISNDEYKELLILMTND